MTFVTRATLPEEFFDITSAMLLVQPEPMYLHASLVKSALAMDLAAEGLGSLGLPLPNRNVGDDGQALGLTNDDMRLLINSPIANVYSDTVKVITDLSKAPGMTVRINRPKFTDTTYTIGSREVAGGATISTTPIAFGSEQTDITIRRLAGPLTGVGGTVAPIGIDRFEASRSLHKLAPIAGMQLKRDYDKFLDKATIALLDAVTNQLWPNGFTADNDFKAAGDGPLDFDMLARAESVLDTANIPRFSNGRRACVLHPRQIQQLKNDGQFMKAAEFYTNKNPLFTSYVATVGNLDIFASANLTTISNSSSVTVYYGQIFGPGALGWGQGEMPRVAYSTADNYGEQALLIWLWYAGAVLLDNRFGCSLRSS